MNVQDFMASTASFPAGEPSGPPAVKRVIENKALEVHGFVFSANLRPGLAGGFAFLFGRRYAAEALDAFERGLAQAGISVARWRSPTLYGIWTGFGYMALEGLGPFRARWEAGLVAGLVPALSPA